MEPEDGQCGGYPEGVVGVFQGLDVSWKVSVYTVEINGESLRFSSRLW